MSRFGPRYRGRHRKPSTTGNTIAKTALAGAVVSAPLVTAGQAQAAPDNVWDRVAQCESGGNWGISTGNGFQGGLQFTQSTWRSFGGSQFASTANRASREEQIVIAEKVLAGQGWNAWPVCSRKAGARGSSATQRTITVKSPTKAPKLSTPGRGDRPADKPVVPTVPSPRRSIEDAVPAVLPPAPAVPPAPAPLLAAATQPAAPLPAEALTALPRLHQPAPATGPDVLLAASPPAVEHAVPAPAAVPTPAAPLAAASAPQVAAAPAHAAPLAAPAPAAAPTGPRHAAPDPVAAPAQAAPPAYAAPAPAQASAPAQPAAGHTYLVRAGDTLSGIATAQRVSGGWQAIYEANRGDLHSANLIRPGQQLHLG